MVKSDRARLQALVQQSYLRERNEMRKRRKESGSAPKTIARSFWEFLLVVFGVFVFFVLLGSLMVLMGFTW